MKPVDAVRSYERKSTREGNNEKRDIIKMEITDEGSLDKLLTVSRNTLEDNL